MKYIAINLQAGFKFLSAGKSVSKTPRKHIARILHAHELFFVQEGELYMEQNGESAVRKDEMLFHFKGIWQAGTKPTSSTFYWLHFDCQMQIFDDKTEAVRFCEENENWGFFAQHFLLYNPERVTLFLNQVNHYYFEQGGEIILNALTTAFFGEIVRQYAQAPTVQADIRFNELLAFIRLNATTDVTLLSLAERFCYNPKYLSRIFNERTGKTLKAYINGIRITLAKKKLLSQLDTVKQIAREVGFVDEYYFMRVFKKETGQTPKEYRETYSASVYT
ncbi:MAG: helix-turn-helix transcriptional regulator [Clostridiales bacterium]|nr:helix-turn-helix transcriptional regulator [Clostridiales bacterium]